MRYIESKIDREQLSMLPIAFDDMISDENAVRAIDAFVEIVDIEGLCFKYSETKETGRMPYNPKDMLKLYVYGYFNGIRTSRKLERDCSRNKELMWLINRLAPDFKTMVDSKHHLVVAIDVISNAADNGQLYSMAEQTKKELCVEELTVLADKGYYNGRDLKSCEENGITAIVSKQKLGSKTGDDNFTKDKFVYDKQNDIYMCPMGKELKRQSGANTKRTRHLCQECSDCLNKANCTTNNKGREVSPTEYQEYYDRADKTFNENVHLYKMRQMLSEHPFGTVKRNLGYTYFLMRGNEKVKCETYMHFLAYNFKRVINILGITQFLDALKARQRKFA